MALIVFDLDGTIVDSSLDLANSTNEMLESYGARALPVPRVVAMVGEGAKVLVARAVAAAGLAPAPPDALARFLGVYSRRLIEHTRPYEGIAEVIRAAARRARLAVLTNKPSEPTRRLLDAFDMAASFTWIVGGDSEFPRKPDPAGVTHLMAQANTPPAETLFVGDSMVDVLTARAAGARMCVAAYGFGHLRGEFVLAGDEIVAHTPADVGLAIDRFIRTAGSSETS